MPKRVPPLSAKALAAVRPHDRPIELVDGYVPGLRVRVLPTGARSWSLNIRDSKGLRRRFNLGIGLALAEARRKAEDVRRVVREGADPTRERRGARERAQAARNGEGTLRELLEMYFISGPGRERRRSMQSFQLVRAVFGSMLEKPSLDIDKRELQLIADGWKSRSSASRAVRLLRPCLKWGEKRGLAPVGAADLDQPAADCKRERVVTPEELKAIWPHLHGSHGNVIKWLLWTGCRLNEAAGMTWAEINSDVWTIPAARAKNGRPRSVPLPRQAVDLLRSVRGNDQNSAALGSFVFPSQGGAKLSNWDRETKRLHVLSGTRGWHRHDLRRSVATLLGDLGFAPHVVSVVLGHAHIADGATAIYARSRYRKEHADALQALADQVESLLRCASNVVSLKVVQG